MIQNGGVSGGNDPKKEPSEAQREDEEKLYALFLLTDEEE